MSFWPLQQNYKAVINKVVSEIGKAKCKNNKTFDVSQSSNIGSNKWWNMTKILTNSHVNNLNNTPLLDGNSVITDDYARANMLNIFFVSQSTLDGSQTQLPFDKINPEVLIEQKIILPEEFCEILLISIYLNLQVLMASVINCYVKLQFLSLNLFVIYSTIL